MQLSWKGLYLDNGGGKEEEEPDAKDIWIAERMWKWCGAACMKGESVRARREISFLLGL